MLYHFIISPLPYQFWRYWLHLHNKYFKLSVRIILPRIARPIVRVTHTTGSKFDCKKKYERIPIHGLFYRFKSFKVTIIEHTVSKSYNR